MLLLLFVDCLFVVAVVVVAVAVDVVVVCLLCGSFVRWLLLLFVVCLSVCLFVCLLACLLDCLHVAVFFVDDDDVDAAVLAIDFGLLIAVDAVVAVDFCLLLLRSIFVVDVSC